MHKFWLYQKKKYLILYRLLFSKISQISTKILVVLDTDQKL